MPHIHTEPNQHDITVSAWIMRIVDGQPKMLVHKHRKRHTLMQIGGHVELDETPWQTLAHELREESGYELGELRILQPFETPVVIHGAINHPVPVLSNTHTTGVDGHFHSDYDYAFIADSEPSHAPAEGESTDLRWLSAAELRQAVQTGDAFEDIADIYIAIIERFLPSYYAVDTNLFSLEKP